MSKELVDAREHECPMPMLKLQKALRKKNAESIEFLMSQKSKKSELEYFLNEKGFEYSIELKDDHLKVLIILPS